MSYKENCTKGPARFHLGRGANPRFHIQTEAGYQIASTTELSHHAQAKEENVMREANAALIAEAFNVLHETGYTPAELAEQAHEYRELLAEARLHLYANLEGLPGNVQRFYANKLKVRPDLQRDPSGRFNPYQPSKTS